MKIYLVGGAIRDSLLHLPIKDKDWVVVGATKKMLLDKNFQQVGKDFPVFLHPETHEEYALARQERKSGKGYSGFSTHYNINITLKDDLIRRDLTINAIAQDKYGNYIDPFNGKRDIKCRILRHVSNAFIEDPLRVLRTARFASSLAHLGFQIAKETLVLMRVIVEKKELLYLTANRIWNETKKALKTENPHVYFQILYSCKALKYLFPEMHYLYEKKYFLNFFHIPNVENKFLIFMGLSKLAVMHSNLNIRFAYLCQFFGMAQYESHIVKSFYNKNAASIVSKLCKRLHVPSCVKNLSMISAGFFDFLKNIHYQSSYNIIMLFLKIDAWRRPERMNQLVSLTNFNFYNVFSNNLLNIRSGDFLQQSFSVINTISVKLILHQGFKGSKIKEELLRLRIKKLELWRSQCMTKI
ncbi:tRNA CCA-pyrophosphorylase [Buchnera aphidicola]|uniref:tRNA CCA-pyrophosphorylase n=1 Tax=Buchnera aphidicola TaxID=9 RepID=UPI003464D832